MPGLKIYRNGAWENSPTPKRYNNGAWEKLTNAKIYQNGAWENILGGQVSVVPLYSRDQYGVVYGVTSDDKTTFSLSIRTTTNDNKPTFEFFLDQVAAGTTVEFDYEISGSDGYSNTFVVKSNSGRGGTTYFTDNSNTQGIKHASFSTTDTTNLGLDFTIGGNRYSANTFTITISNLLIGGMPYILGTRGFVADSRSSNWTGGKPTSSFATYKYHMTTGSTYGSNISLYSWTAAPGSTLYMNYGYSTSASAATFDVYACPNRRSTANRQLLYSSEAASGSSTKIAKSIVVPSDKPYIQLYFHPTKAMSVYFYDLTIDNLDANIAY